MSTADPAGALRLAPVFAALGDPTRLALLERLSDGRARSITALAEGAPLTRQSVTKHLGVLAQAGVVTRERRGRETRFATRPELLDEARAYLDTVAAHWDEALERLKAHVETG